MTSFITRESVCPVCVCTVEITVLTSTNYVGQHSDFHRITMGYAPLPLMMNTCSMCGYSGFTDDFANPASLTPELRTKILASLRHIVGDVPLDAGRRYELYALQQELAGADAWQMAHHYLRAAWAARDDGSPNEPNYQHFALDFFETALTANLVPPDQLPSITYLIGELYRRVGDTAAAATWFNTVIERAQSQPDWNNFATLAQRQRDHPSDTLA
jgi:uncharacterized protein (DUF2225 family)